MKIDRRGRVYFVGETYPWDVLMLDAKGPCNGLVGVSSFTWRQAGK